MKFSYETQGAYTYLVCELDANESIDNLTLGMLTNNHIVGLAPVLYTEMNGERYLKYNISAKITSEQFFSGSVNNNRLLSSLQNIVNALCSADEYMIDQNCFSLEPEHVYLNVSSCETALICIPVIVDKDVKTETISLFKKLLGSVKLSPGDNSTNLTQLVAYLDNYDAFSIYGFNDLITKLNAEPAYQYLPSANAHAPTATSFDSTISIDDMPGLLDKNNGGFPGQPPVQPAVQPSIQPPVQPAVQPSIQPPVQPAVQPSIQPPVQPAVQPSIQPPVQQPVYPGANMGAPVQVPGRMNAPMTGNVAQKGVTPPVTPAQPQRNNPGFAIPGQNFGPSSEETDKKNKNKKAEKDSKKAKKQAQNETPDNNSEKKMSFIKLMAHYNKENAAIYKSQKEARKKDKAETASSVPPAVPGGFGPGAQKGNPIPGIPVEQGYPQGGFTPPVQPVPVQSSFNETTVLSNFGGETTVLSGAAPIAAPTLLRIKSGEKIAINKPVFRIGKERSYVDYFIGDNTAISRSHANIHTENGEYFIEDTNSTNHTYLNGVIVSSSVKVKLTSGDKIKLANEEFIFSC